MKRAIVRAVMGGAALLALAAPAAWSADTSTPCRIAGHRHEVQCGEVARPLDPARPDGTRIAVHYVVVPALARRKWPDPVLLLAGGPGQSAIELAGPLSRMSSPITRRMAACT